MNDKTYIYPFKNLSYNFLYSLLGFSKNMSKKPEATYLYWKDENIEDYKLNVFFATDYNTEFQSFERGEILKNDKLVSCYTVEEGMMYVFDLVTYAKDVAEFLDGKYSRYSKEAKDAISKYFMISKNDTPDYDRPIHMALYPEFYFDKVAEELGYPNSDYLKRVGELCPKYKLEEETAHFKIVKNCNCVTVKQMMIDWK